MPIIALAVNAGAQKLDDAGPPMIREDDRAAPVDWGYGAGVRPSSDMRAAQGMMTAPAAPGAAAAPAGGPDARSKGTFGPPVTWPIIGLHAVLLPDGRVMSFASGEKGQQGGQFVYDVWDPKLGTGLAAHMVLPNTTNTDVFCAGQSVIAASGQV